MLMPMVTRWPLMSYGAPAISMIAAREQRGVFGLLDVALHDGELVAAEPADGIDLADAGLQPLGDGAQQFVADRMAERIVDLLEMIDVDREHGKAAAAAHVGDRLLDALAEHHAIGQAGERVVAGHVGDALLGLAALGDVLVGGDEAAIGRRPVDASHHAIAGQFDEVRAGR